jgi:molecular chaperone DnaK (HSP70)
MSNQQRIVIGLDYGTTFTGVAFADSSGTIRDIQLITDWPGPHGHNAVNEKVPSQVAYGSFPPGDDIYPGYCWGNLIPPNTERQYWTKLQLDKKAGRPRELQMLLALLSNDFGAIDLNENDDEEGPPAYPGKEPKDIVTDYLTGVKNHVFRSMKRTFGAALFDSCLLDVVITVPAVWSDKAKDLTFQAVANAGFVGDKERIKMVTEPEAAATYTLKSLKAGAGGDDFKVYTPLGLWIIYSNNLIARRVFCTLRCGRWDCGK